MNIAIIGRSEMMYDVATELSNKGHSVKLIVTAKEAPEYKRKSQDFKELSERLQCSFLYKPSVTPEDIAQSVTSHNIEIAVSINYTGVISQEVIDLFPRGILNAHGGDLPRYRGNACQAWAILNGESKIGLCIHKMIGGYRRDLAGHGQIDFVILKKISTPYYHLFPLKLAERAAKRF